MSDLTVSAAVTRTDLGLSNLNINDHDKYILSTTILGGSVAWQKNQVSSPYVDGDITITRRRPTVIEPFEVYVYGTSGATLMTNTQALIDAFSQDSFSLSVTINGATRQYACETADYSLEYSHTKFASHMCTVRFQLPRNPIPTVGV